MQSRGSLSRLLRPTGLKVRPHKNVGICGGRYQEAKRAGVEAKGQHELEVFACEPNDEW